MLIDGHKFDISQLDVVSSDSLIQLLNNALMEHMISGNGDISFAEPGLPVKIIYPIYSITDNPVGPKLPLPNHIPDDALSDLTDGLCIIDNTYDNDLSAAQTSLSHIVDRILPASKINGIYDFFIEDKDPSVDINVCDLYLRRAYVRDNASLRAVTNHYTELSNDNGTLDLLRDTENAKFYSLFQSNDFIEASISRDIYLEGLRGSDFVFILIEEKLYMYGYTLNFMYSMQKRRTEIMSNLHQAKTSLDKCATCATLNANAAYKTRADLREAQFNLATLTSQVDNLTEELNNVVSTIEDTQNYEMVSMLKEENRRLKDLERLVIRGHDSNGIQSQHLTYEEPIDAIFDIRNININSKGIYVKYRYNLQSKTVLETLERDWDKLLTSIVVDNNIPSSMIVSESAIGFTFSGKHEDLSLSAYGRNLGSAVMGYNTTSGLGTKITKIEYALVLMDNLHRTYSVRVTIS